MCSWKEHLESAKRFYDTAIEQVEQAEQFRKANNVPEEKRLSSMAYINLYYAAIHYSEARFDKKDRYHTPPEKAHTIRISRLTRFGLGLNETMDRLKRMTNRIRYHCGTVFLNDVLLAKGDINLLKTELVNWI